jgi:hypothetical protein
MHHHVCLLPTIAQQTSQSTPTDTYPTDTYPTDCRRFKTKTSFKQTKIFIHRFDPVHDDDDRVTAMGGWSGPLSTAIYLMARSRWSSPCTDPASSSSVESALRCRRQHTEGDQNSTSSSISPSYAPHHCHLLCHVPARRRPHTYTPRLIGDDRRARMTICT